ncbi:MAG: hypothetical protein WCO73_02485 [Verrucomicrobiota bacterium]
MPFILLILIICSGYSSFAAEALPDLPDSLGRGGMAAVTIVDESGHEAILAIGGSNFPDKQPWDGGIKKFYGDILLLSRETGSWYWRKIGEMPEPIAYAAFCSSTDRKSMILAGGCNATTHLRNTWQINSDGQIKPLAPLPTPRAYAGHAVHRGRLTLLGGSSEPDTLKTELGWNDFDLSKPDAPWRAFEATAPHGILPLCGSTGDFLFYGSGCLLTGIDGKSTRLYQSKIFSNDFRTTPKDAQLTHPIAAAAGPGVAVGPTLFFVGGDDGHHYPKPAQDHPGLSSDIIAVTGIQIKVVGQWPHPVVTAPLLRLGNDLVTVGGENKPGFRTAKVSSWTIPLEYR